MTWRNLVASKCTIFTTVIDRWTGVPRTKCKKVTLDPSMKWLVHRCALISQTQTNLVTARMPRCLPMARWAFCSMLLNISQASTKKSCTLAVGDEGAIADVDENVVQELISQAHMNLTERPHLHVPIQSVPCCSMKGPVCGGTSSLLFLQVVSQNKLN